ncbi:MAG: hypothetical protein QM808_16825 [Steroidobacteraceae bacterium]
MSKTHTGISLLAAAMLLAFSGAAMSQGAPPAGAPAGGQGGMGGGMQPAADSKDDIARKAVVQGFGDLIDAGKVDEAFEKYVSKDFVEHAYTPRRMSGKDKMGYNDVMPFFKQFMAGTPGDKAKLVEIMVVNDEMVTYHGRKGQDIFRVVNGKITDHWDTIHQGAAPPAPVDAPAASGGMAAGK